MKELKENFLVNEKGAKVQSLYGVPMMLFENAFTMKSAEVEFLKVIYSTARLKINLKINIY